MENKRVNMDIDKELWKKAGIKAAELEITKKELVEMGLKKIIEEN